MNGSKSNDIIWFEQFQLLYENSRDILLFVRLLDGRILEASRSALEAYQYSRQELLSKTIFDLRAPDTASEIITQMSTADHSGVLFETSHRRKDGTVFPVEVSSQGASIEGERILFSIVRDITERKQAEQAIIREQRELENIMDIAPVMIFYKDRGNRFIRVNRALAEASGLTREEMEGKSVFDLYPTRADGYWKDDMDVMASGKPKRGIVEVIETPKGLMWIRTDKFPYRNDVGKVTGVIGFSVDITELKQMEEGLREMALRDPLTGLYNRRGFITLAEQQLKTVKRSKRPLLLTYVDIDGLKHINDTLGHEEGDRALTDTADILRGTFRESDIIARIGGDEFAVLSLDVADMNREAYSARLQGNVDAFNALRQRPYPVALSWDTAVCDPKAPLSLDKLLSAADQLMYRHKKDK
jgi:diguanylate cyclase (GGDEF)-like protein/PAS domain S-box-containing protein